MDLFDTAPTTTTSTPVDVFNQYITSRDAKGAVRYLRSLDKDTLRKVLLLTGFGITGNYREWINYQAQRLLDAAARGALPRVPAPGEYEAWSRS